MFQHFLNPRRLMAILLIAVLALVQANIALAGCVTADSEVSEPMTMIDGCPGCAGTSNGDDSYDTLSTICSNHCLQNLIISAKNSTQPTFIPIASAPVDIAAEPPLILPLERILYRHKTPLIYRLQRLLI